MKHRDRLPDDAERFVWHVHDNLKSLHPDPVAAIEERSRTSPISFDLALA
jgi:hypothetical protein